MKSNETSLQERDGITSSCGWRAHYHIRMVLSICLAELCLGHCNESPVLVILMAGALESFYQSNLLNLTVAVTLLLFRMEISYLIISQNILFVH